jgi:hypothetical protein
MVCAGWGVSRGGGDNCGAVVGAGAFRIVPGGPAQVGGAASFKIGPSETTVSPPIMPQQFSIPFPLWQQRRPNHGRSGQQKQQPLANSKLPATIDIQRARTMRCVPLS